MAILQTYPEAADPFRERSDAHSGLDFAYGAGRVRNDNVITDTAAGTVVLTDEATNYIEVTTAGVVSANTTAFTAGRIPLFTVVTAASAIGTVTDKRAFLSNDADVVAAHDLGGASHSADTLANLNSKISDATLSNKKGIAFYIDGEQEVALKASAVAPLALTVQEVRLAVDVAPTGAALIVDILKNGTTMFSTVAKPQIAAGATSGTSAAPDVTAIAVGDKITAEVTQIGSTNAGEDLSVTVVCEVASP